MYKLIDVNEFLLQSSFRNPIEFYYNWIVVLCMMCDDWALYHELFIYLDMFYIPWHRLAKKDLCNKVYMNMKDVYSAADNTRLYDDGWCHLVCASSSIIAESFTGVSAGTTTPLCGSVSSTNHVSTARYHDLCNNCISCSLHSPAIIPSISAQRRPSWNGTDWQSFVSQS
jgi:hypothetical protein